MAGEIMEQEQGRPANELTADLGLVMRWMQAQNPFSTMWLHVQQARETLADKDREIARLRSVLRETVRTALLAEPLPGFPIEPEDRRVFRYGVDCAVAAVSEAVAAALQEQQQEGGK